MPWIWIYYYRSYLIDPRFFKLSEWGQVGIIFLDFHKAFDKVNHWELILRLEGVFKNQEIIWWIQTFLHERKQLARIEGWNLQFGNARSGIPQGSVLWPQLLLVFINGVLKGINCHATLFVNNCIVYTEINNDFKFEGRVAEALKRESDWSRGSQVAIVKWKVDGREFDSGT